MNHSKHGDQALNHDDYAKKHGSDVFPTGMCVYVWEEEVPNFTAPDANFLLIETFFKFMFSDLTSFGNPPLVLYA